jgi:cytochrome c oxidase assembly factor CtaG
MLLALVSPIDTLGDEYLFSAHMLQHLMLILAVPPLLLLGITPNFVRKVLEYQTLCAIERVLGNGVVAWTVGVTTLTLWHLPVLFDAALNNEYVHILEHLCFMVSATIFWWPVLASLPECRLSPLGTQLYLLGGAIANGLLGIWLTFLPAAIYTPYLNPGDSLGIVQLLRSQWGITPVVDQQTGGLLMWIGGGFVFVTIMVTMFLRWFSSTEAEVDSVASIV